MRYAFRLWRTIRHLRPVQLYGRLWYLLARPRPDLASAPCIWSGSAIWQPPAYRAPSMTGPRVFRLLNENGSLDAHGWDNPAKAKLWRYNQHYFDDLNAEGAESRGAWHQALITDWIAANPPGQGTGWEPYPTSLRIVNWIKWALAGNSLNEAAQHSLAVQTRWLMRRLEWHLLGNHLFSNAKALIFAGFYFDGPEAANWRKQAMAILFRELPEQILPDGGHFELSPMYHALAVEDLADIVNLMTAYGSRLSTAEQALARGCAARLPGMLRWLNIMSHPDGKISFFNDAAFGVAPDNDCLHAYAARLGISVAPLAPGLTYLVDSGFARMARGSIVVLCDVGRIGPDYLPGHAHADTLSFELSLGTERVIVNSGTSEYGTSTERLRQRGTSAHSTVQVGNEDSSEVWSGFRVAQRARVYAIQANETCEALILAARHDGYTRLPRGPNHSRSWQLTDTTLRVVDRLEPAAKGVARYYLPNGVIAEATSSDAGTLRLASGRVLRWYASGATANVEDSTWHPRFGLSLPSQCLSLAFTGDLTFDLTFDPDFA